MKQISKNELQSLKKTPGDGWYIIEAAGVYPKVLGADVTVTENLAPEVLAAVAEAGVPAEGLFVDVEHESLDGGSTAAKGWVKELALCGDALAARIEWTAEGLPLIRGKVYKHFSTVYPCDTELQDGDTFTPARLTGLTLTNMPNNGEGQPPISNGCGDPKDKKKTFSSTLHGAGEEIHNNNTNTMNPELLKALGLPENATEEEAIARAADMANELADLRTAAADAADHEADAIINAEESEAGAKLDEEEKEDVKEMLLENRERGKRYLHALVANKAAQTQNGAAGTTTRRYPSKPAHEVQNKQQTKSELALANARAREIVAEAQKRGEKVLYGVAFARAKRELANKK